MKKYILPAALSLAVLMTSCGKIAGSTDSTISVKDDDSPAVSDSGEFSYNTKDERQDGDGTPDSSDSNPDEESEKNSFALIYYGNNCMGDIEELDDILSLTAQLEEIEPDGIIVYDNYNEWSISFYNNDVMRYSRVYTSEGWLIASDSLTLYKDSPELNEYLIELSAKSEHSDYHISEEYYYSVKCDEPSTEEEYRDAAVSCVTAWLTSLQSAYTEDYYRNTGFTIAELLDDGKRKTNYLSCGIVNGNKEFVVEVCFTAEDCGENTFYDKYYQEGRYTEAGTFWSGNYICGRFRYSDGECTLIDIATRDGSETLQQGLNGIQSGEYKNFYEFARRDDLDKAIEDSFLNENVRFVASKNLTVTEDGKPINIDIYSDGDTEIGEDTYTAVMFERAYMSGEMKYSTGVYFTDNETGKKVLTLPQDFRLTFDNYDGDGNPDYCVKYDEDEYGSYYVLESVQSDGRIFNLSGRAYEGGIYLADCFNASPRLQKTDDIAYVGWKYEDGKYYPTDSSGEATKLPELNMYSDRYYLPLNTYAEDENTVTCFLWNNTENEVTSDGKYDIEINEKGKWKTVSKGLSAKPVKISPRGYAEVSYDISGIGKRYNCSYRIVQKCGSLTAYGSFALEGEEVQTLSVTAEDIPAGAVGGSFTVSDSGIAKTGITSAAIKSGADEYPLAISNEDNDTYSYLISGVPLQGGEYTLVVNGSAECNLKVFDSPRTSADIKASADLIVNGMSLTLQPTEDCELEEVNIYQNNNGVWEPVYLEPDSDSSAPIKAGESAELALKDVFAMLGEDYLYETYESVKAYYYDDEQTLFDELGLTPDASFEQFCGAIRSKYCVDPEAEHYALIEYMADGKRLWKYIML